MTIGEEMEIGHFYYIDDQYFKDFPDSYLMQNKEKVNGQLHDRPCFMHSRIVIRSCFG